MKISILRPQENIITGHEENTSNILQDREFCYLGKIYTDVKNNV